MRQIVVALVLCGLLYSGEAAAQKVYPPKQEGRMEGSGKKPMGQSSSRTANASAKDVREPRWGITFTPPQGWIAQKTDAGFLLGSEMQKGFIVITPHQYCTMEELRAAASDALIDENGTELTLRGAVKPFGERGVVADFSGTVEWQPANARAIGLLSPYGGGVTIFAMVEAKSYTPEYASVVESIAKSVKFSKPDIQPLVDQWKEKLRSSRLTFMESYSSGTAGGYTSEVVISLCRDGRFHYRSSGVVSVDMEGASGSSGGRERGAGQWQVIAQMGQPVLELRFADGKVRQYVVTYPDNKLHLNGERYYLTNDAECP